MLCAISGETPEEMALLLQQIAADDKRTIDTKRRDYDPKDWLEAIKRLGGIVQTKEPTRPLPTIDEWMKANTPTNQLIVVASDNFKPKEPEGHVFATQNGNVVDGYTDGKMIRYPGPHPRLAKQKVYAIHIVT
jgi:hypothetical protein